MPKATVSQETERFELRSLPDGYVELRTLSFHEMQTRQDIAARMYQEQTTPKRGEKRPRQETVRGYFEIMNVAVTEFEFRNCIVDHNLEDENGTLIDFTQPMRAWRLDPKVGGEIGNLIDQLNQFDVEEDETLVPLAMRHSSSSLTGASTSPGSTENE